LPNPRLAWGNAPLRVAGSISAALIALVALATGPAFASERPVSMGLQAAWTSRSSAGLGGRIGYLLPRGFTGFEVSASACVFFPSDGLGMDLSHWDLTFDLAHRIGIKRRSPNLYAGPGLVLTHRGARAEFLGVRVTTSDAAAAPSIVGGLRLRAVRATLLLQFRVAAEPPGGQPDGTWRLRPTFSVGFSL
jgi:hypothetical protein